ncbi:MAG TPA: hypothetical protein VM821_03860 [Abditibacteriaceae bacterium]|nr:hypothetical protein [Abditibacteriaceae bacterium]
MQNLISRRKTLSGLAALFVVASSGLLSSTRPALAHEAPCPYCQITITQDTPTQDNETVLKYGRKRIEYKCVFCALAEAKTEYTKGDLTILAPSEKKGAPVELKRSSGKWSAPATAAFVSPQRIKHKVCHAQVRAFTGQAAAQSYAKKNGGDVLNLKQLLAQAK